MQLQTLKRLVIEDFPQENQQLISKIAFIYNPLVDQLNTVFNKNINFQNLNQQVITFTTTVDAKGVPTSSLTFQSTLNTPVQGILCMSAANQTDSTLLTGAPFIQFIRSSGSITITQITGLVAGKTYSITAILVGQ